MIDRSLLLCFHDSECHPHWPRAMFWGEENGVETLKQDESKEENIGNMQFWTK